MTALTRTLRRPLMLLGLIALLTATWGGLTRIGWTLPTPSASWAAQHGPLMISGFLGTVIGLERAVARNKLWAFLGPTFTALGAVVTLVSGFALLGGLLFTLGSLVMVLIFLDLWRLYPALPLATMGLAALGWAVGNGVWVVSRSPASAVPWWMAFLVLTIAAERVELGQLLALPRAARRSFVAAAGLVGVGTVVSLLQWLWGVRLMGVGFLALTLWLATHDIAWRTVRQEGLPRYVAVGLLTGYVWLAVAGLIAAVWGSVKGGFFYDALLHAVFLGFVMSMTFAHAPIIFPAVVNVKMPFSNLFYLPLLVLHASTAMRVAGDLMVVLPARRLGGLANGVAILLFLLTVAITVVRGRKPSH